MIANRYARQILIFGEEGQKKIEASHVSIVGLGGIGSHIVQGLAYLGVGSFTVIDDDYIDETSMNRSIGAIPADVENKTAKVIVAERLIKQVNPNATIHAIPKNLRSQEAIDALISCPVIFGCVDHDGPRLILMELAAAYESILIDSATEIFAESNFGGRVVVARPGDFCLNCAHEIDLEVAKQELETPAIRELRKAHGYGLGEEVVAPSVVSLNGVIANIAITEFLVMTTGIREPNRYLHYRAFQGNVNLRQDKRKDDCYTCGYLAGSRERANIFRYVHPGISGR